jgi:hypothetical protein
MSTYVCSDKFDEMGGIVTHVAYVFTFERVRSRHIFTGLRMINNFI